MTVKELFDFVIDQSIADEDVDDYLEKVFPCIIYSVCLFESFRPDPVYTRLVCFLFISFFPPFPGREITALILKVLQVQQKVVERGETVAQDDEIAPTVFVQVLL